MKTKSSAIFIALACGLAFLPKTHAVVPAPDGCYPNFTTAEGCDALNLLTTGAANTGLGWRSLFSDSTGSFNTGVGAGALVLNNGDANTAVGGAALLLNIIGNGNTAVGVNALLSNVSGDSNTAIGYRALSALTSGVGNIAIGLTAGESLTNGNANIYIGSLGFAAESNKLRIGADGSQDATFIAAIYAVDQGGTGITPVYINSFGQLGTQPPSSSRRYKQEIKPMDNASDSILRLKPVTFHYKSDEKGSPQFGLIAEEVAEANPDLVVRNKNGEIYSVRYDAVNAMLLNEFLKEHRKVEEQKAAIAELKSVVAQQQKEFRAAMAEQRKEMENVVARLKQQEAKIQKVNDRIELTKPAPQAVANNE
jgi:hypothetical protein